MIKGFWHIYMINHWYSIVADQMRIILVSGLYDAVSEINIGCIGSEKEKSVLQKYFIDLYPKLKIKYYGQEPTFYEFPTIKLIEDDIGEYFGFYFHTKGVTKPSDSVVNHWRAWLNEAILNRWRLHYNNIRADYDISGVNVMYSPDHFSGNFWWFNRRYVKKLPKISSLDLDNRYHAEQWIMMCKNKRIFKGEFKEPGIDTFKML